MFDFRLGVGGCVQTRTTAAWERPGCGDAGRAATGLLIRDKSSLA